MAKVRGPGSRTGGRVRHRRAELEPLEPRLLLSADLPVVAPDAVLPPVHAPVEASEVADSLRDTQTTTTEQHARAREVVFVDGGVEGHEALVDEVLARRGDGGAVSIVVLDPAREGVAQIGEVLAAYDHELDAVHVLAHGSERGLRLGATWLDGGTLAARADAVAGWGGALADGADLLLYGCNLAGSAEGLALVDAVARLTGADVAASVDLTGSALRGGDWELEHRTGAIEAAAALGTDPRWNGVLATVLDRFDIQAYDNDDGTQPWASDWQELGESTDPSSGLVRVVVDSQNDALRIGASSESSITGRGAVREADLSGSTTATLTFDYRREFGDEPGGSVLVEISGDGGSSWTTLQTYAIDTNDPGLIAASFDVSSFVAADTQIRFVGSGNVQENTFFYADNVRIEFSFANTAPVLLPLGASLPAITEDKVDNPGELVSTILGGSVSDVDVGSVEGIAVTALDSGNGTWEYSTDGGATWGAVGPVSDTSALLLRDSDRVRFVPDGENADAASFTYRAWDQTLGVPGARADASSHGLTTAFSVLTDTASITVTAVNDAPVLAPVAPTLPAITEDDTTNPGELVSSLLGASVTDVDTGAVAGIAVTGLDVDTGAVAGIAVTGLASGNGTWEYSTDGGATWSAVGPVSDTSALLLRDSDRVRFVPDGENADAASFTYRAWDQTSGAAGSQVDASANGGTTAFSSATDTASISVTAVNDAPVLTPVAPSLPTITEDDTTNPGELVSSLLGGSVSDVDTGAVVGMAVTGLASGNGTWEYSTDGGATWSAVGPVSDTSALLLRDTDRVRFVPDGENADAASFTYRAWDQTVGAAGTQVDASTNGGTTGFSTATDTASITVTALNNAPVLTPAAPSLPSITEDDTTNPGELVSTLLGASVADVDTGAVQGIAITGLASGNGTWEYSTDGGATWSAVGPVSDTSALLLRDTDRVRFVPDGENADAASFTYRAWDQTSGAAGSQVDATGNGGTTPFSTATDTASIAVIAVNDAPALADAALGAVPGDAIDPAGEALASLFAGGFSDVDAGGHLAGVAVVGNAADPATEGVWQYSTDGGTSWFAVGGVGDGPGALALGAGALVRFVPAAGFDGAPAALMVRGLDDAYAGGVSSTAGGTESRAQIDTSASGGTTPVAGAPTAVSVTVTPVEGPPPELLPDLGELVPEDLEPLAPPHREPPAPAPAPAPPGGATETQPEAEPPVSAPSPPPELPGPGPDVSTAPPSLTQAPTDGEEAATETVEVARTTPRDSDLDTERVGPGREMLRELLSRVTGTSIRDLILLNQLQDFFGELDAVRDEAEARAYLETKLVGTTVAVTTGLSVGYVIWLTRGGLLLASLLSSMPAWRLIDPVPILTRLRTQDEEEEDEESLDSLVRGHTASEGAEPGGAPSNWRRSP